MTDPCLACPLDECDEADPGCGHWRDKEKPHIRYYRIHKVEPEFKRRNYKHKKKWRKTPSGRDSMRKTAADWRARNPETSKRISRDYHERNKERRLREARQYKRRKRMEEREVWIFTSDGFYSIVSNNYCQSDEVMVRSRDKSDFTRLEKKIDLPTILENKKEDYRFFVILKRTVLASYLSGAVFDIHYPDFKEYVASVDGNQKRQIAYLNAWFSIKNAFHTGNLKKKKE